MEHIYHVSERQMADMALAAAKEGSRQSLNELGALLGVNMGNVESIDNFRKDLSFIRVLREGSSKAGNRAFMAMITIIVSALSVAFWEGIKHSLHIG